LSMGITINILSATIIWGQNNETRLVTRTGVQIFLNI